MYLLSSPKSRAPRFPSCHGASRIEDLSGDPIFPHPSTWLTVITVTPSLSLSRQRQSLSTPHPVARVRQEGVSYGALRTAVGEARHLASDKLSLVIYSRSSERGKCNNFFRSLGHFPLCFPLGEVWPRFYLERCAVTCSILPSTY